MTLWSKKPEKALPGSFQLVYNCCMKINVSHIATLANLKLSSEEENKLESQLSEILSYVEKLENVSTENIEETSQVTGLENILREDETLNCELSQEEATSGSDSTQNGLFKVKGVLPNE